MNIPQATDVARLVAEALDGAVLDETEVTAPDGQSVIVTTVDSGVPGDGWLTVYFEAEDGTEFKAELQVRSVQ